MGCWRGGWLAGLPLAFDYKFALSGPGPRPGRPGPAGAKFRIEMQGEGSEGVGGRPPGDCPLPMGGGRGGALIPLFASPLLCGPHALESKVAVKQYICNAVAEASKGGDNKGGSKQQHVPRWENYLTKATATSLRDESASMQAKLFATAKALADYNLYWPEEKLFTNAVCLILALNPQEAEKATAAD